LCARIAPPGVLIERDDHFPPDAVLNAELDAVAEILRIPSPAERARVKVGARAAPSCMT
jgi:uncharacterized protein (UPF0276 family)